MIRKFEIPFNHDPNYLDFLIKNKKILHKYIEHIFIAPFEADYKSTRHVEALKPTSRDVYEDQIKQLHDSGYRISILFNMPEVPSDDLINYYINVIKASSFIVHNDDVARKLKHFNVLTIASITKRLQLEDIKTKDLSMYDYIVLDYTFNASYNRIEQLPSIYKYILMVNTYCDYTCNFHMHWSENPNYVCPKDINGYKNTTYIHPLDLYKFDKYISIYKIQGREYPTRTIERDIMAYIFQQNMYMETDVNHNDENYYYRYKGK